MSDPRGHSYGHVPTQATPLSADAWWHNEAYLFGFDLFNHGYYWEAHEVWESLWRLAGGNDRQADFLKGLIKLAAAGVKARAGLPAGVISHARRAAELFDQAADGHVFGCDSRQLAQLARAVADDPPAADPRAAVARVFGFYAVPLLSKEKQHVHVPGCAGDDAGGPSGAARAQGPGRASP